MAATGKTPILLYGSTTPTNAPVAGNLTNSSDGCEIAINVADKNLFFKDSSNNVNTVPIRQSSASSDGWLSSTDWSTFNSKQPAGTYVTSVTGTAPVVSSGGTTPAISMAAATSSVNGYLTSTDWSTFNGKQAALVSGSNIKTVNGTSLLGSGDVGTIDVSHGGTGLTSVTANRIPYGNGTSALNTSASFTYDGTTFTSNAIYSQTAYAASNWIASWNNNGTSGHQMYFGYNNGVDNRIGLYIAGGPGTTNQLDFSVASKFSVYGGGGVVVGSSGDPGNGNLGIGNGNLVIGTSGKGIDFSATAGTGTSELLADYEEGTWTPVVTAASGTITTVGTVSGTYTKVGRQVTVQYSIAITTNGTGAGQVVVDGLPYTSGSSRTEGIGQEVSATGKSTCSDLLASRTYFLLTFYDGTYPGGNGRTMVGVHTYFV